MSRPTFTIVESATNPRNGYDQVVQTIDVIYHLTYKGKLAKIRQDSRIFGGGFKYKKSSWATEKTGWTQVKKLCALYGCDDFGLMEIRPNPEGSSTPGDQLDPL